MSFEHDLNQRTKSEAEFHDARIHEVDEKRLGYVYRSVADIYEFTRVPPALRDRNVLEIGCFRGDGAAGLRNFAGNYVGIDISPAAIEHCNSLGLAPNIRFMVDDASNLATVADRSVDFAFGNGVLHHLDLERFAVNFARTLAPGGCGRFIEPARGNVLVRTFRRMTPGLRTPDEHPFDAHSLSLLARHLHLEIGYHALLRPYVPMLFFNRKIATDISRWADEKLLRLQALRPQAWLLCITLRSKAAPPAG